MIRNDKPLNHRQIALNACKNLRLTKRETKLFLFYESCKMGFHPALKEVEKNTGIAKNKISEIRKKLNDKCMIKYSCEKQSLRILWKAVTNYANGVFPANGFGYYTPDDYDYYLVKLKYLNKWSENTGSCAVLSDEQLKFLAYLGNITCYEYELLLSTFPEKREFPSRRIFYVYFDDEEQRPEEDAQKNLFKENSNMYPADYYFPDIDNPLPF